MENTWRKLTLGFAFTIYTNGDGFERPGNALWGDSSNDAAPFHHRNAEAQYAHIFNKTVRVDMYRPNFAKRHLIDLGSAEVPMPPNWTALFWNRHLIFEENKDTGNYHAFLYANLEKIDQRNRSSDRKKKFMAYAPLLKIGHGAGGRETSTTQQNGNSEYQVTMPVKFDDLFTHKLWNIKICIYQFKELPRANQQCQQNQSSICANQSEEACPICLEILQSENHKIIKLHGKGTDYEHKYHANCITRWIETKEMLRCPLCLTDPKLIIVADFAPIFFDSVHLYQKMFVNPTAHLFKIANSDEGNDRFGHSQALHAFNSIQQKIDQAERGIKQSLAAMEVPLLMDKLFGETFFELGFDGFVEKQILENVRRELETIVELNFTQQMMDKAKEVLKLIKATREEAESEAMAALETIQMIKEEEEEEEGEGAQ